MNTRHRHRRASGLTALPQGPSLRSGLCCPSPSSLNRPHPPHSPTRRNFPALRVICDAFAVLVHSTSLGCRRAVPSFRIAIPSQPVALVCPRRVHRLLTPRLRRRPSPSSGPSFGLGTLNCSTSIRFMWILISGLPGSLAWYNRLSCLPLWRTGPMLPSASRGFYFRAFGRVGHPPRRRI